MPWLIRDGEVLASLELATSRRARRHGLLGRDHVDGALLIRPARAVHTVGMRFPIDVAFCDDDLRVIEVLSMARHRVGRPRLGARQVVEARRGAFARWGLQVGDALEIR